MALVTAAVVVLDCAEPEKLAHFYRELLDGEPGDTSTGLVEVRRADGIRIAFRRDGVSTPASWPRPENSLQSHLVFLVDDMDEAERRVVGLGGLPTETRDPTMPYEERGYSDPAGHPFTLRPALPAAG
ncbi:VOC family protein [Streptomyces sp. NPDC059627]